MSEQVFIPMYLGQYTFKVWTPNAGSQEVPFWKDSPSSEEVLRDGMEGNKISQGIWTYPTINLAVL